MGNQINSSGCCLWLNKKFCPQLVPKAWEAESWWFYHLLDHYLTRLRLARFSKPPLGVNSDFPCGWLAQSGQHLSGSEIQPAAPRRVQLKTAFCFRWGWWFLNKPEVLTLHFVPVELFEKLNLILCLQPSALSWARAQFIFRWTHARETPNMSKVPLFVLVVCWTFISHKISIFSMLIHYVQQKIVPTSYANTILKK